MVKYCKDCKWSEVFPNEWDQRCLNPIVNSKDSWALSAPRITGTSCRAERDKKWFAECGMSGHRWESKYADV